MRRQRHEQGRVVARLGGGGRRRRAVVRGAGAEPRRVGQRRLAGDRRRSASTSSPTASTASSSPTGCCGSTTRGRRRRCATTTAWITCRRTSGCCTATISPRSPAPGRWSARCWPRRWAILPGTLWILVGVVFAGAVQDFIVLFVSVRRDGKSLGEMIKMELGPVPGLARAGRRAGDHDHHPRGAGARRGQGARPRARGASSPSPRRSRSRCSWASTCGCIRPGRVGEASAIGVVLLLLSLVLGRTVADASDAGVRSSR